MWFSSILSHSNWTRTDLESLTWPRIFRMRRGPVYTVTLCYSLSLTYSAVCLEDPGSVLPLLGTMAGLLEKRIQTTFSPKKICCTNVYTVDVDSRQRFVLKDSPSGIGKIFHLKKAAIISVLFACFRIRIRYLLIRFKSKSELESGSRSICLFYLPCQNYDKVFKK